MANPGSSNRPIVLTERDLDGYTRLVDQVAEVVRAVPGVHDLHGGAIAQVATYLPGRRIPGLRLDENGCAIHIAVDDGVHVDDVARRIRAAVQPLIGALRVDIVVEDVIRPHDLPVSTTPEDHP